MNPTLLKIAKENKGLILSGVGAFIRGEDPVTWIKKVAQTHPALRDYNLDDPIGTAEMLCHEKNVDQAQLTSEIKEFANSYKDQII